MKRQGMLLALHAGSILAGSAVLAQDNSTSATLITGARIFDGVGPDLIDGQDVLIEDGMISEVGPGLAAPDGAQIIEAEGRVMTPGFIDVHYHLSLCNVPVMDMAGSGAPDLDYIGIKASQAAEETLMRGFTSLRDVGGASWGAKLASDRGEIAGPRVWPSLRTLSQFGGHGDANSRFMDPREFGGPENNLERLGYSRIVNGRDDVLAAARENLKRGASQIKMHLAGGVGTEFDPIDGRQFVKEEIEAAVEVADGLAPMSQPMSTLRAVSNRRSKPVYVASSMAISSTMKSPK